MQPEQAVSVGLALLLLLRIFFSARQSGLSSYPYQTTHPLLTMAMGSKKDLVLFVTDMIKMAKSEANPNDCTAGKRVVVVKRVL